jgi:hypothetical protein
MKINFGDILAIELLNKMYMFIQIIYQIPAGNKKELAKINPKSRLLEDRPFYNGCYIIDVYKQISKDMILKDKDKMFKGLIALSGSDIKKSKYTIISHEEINVEEIEFPETVRGNSRSGYCLQRGEMKIFINDWKKIEVELENAPTGGFMDSYSYGDSVLYFQNRKNEMQRKYSDDWKFYPNDLRYYPELRNKIYKMIGEDTKQNYYKMALKYGFDLRKLYE